MGGRNRTGRVFDVYKARRFAHDGDESSICQASVCKRNARTKMVAGK
jgi:hypothetical protein